MALSYVQEKVALAVDALVVAVDIKSGLREALNLLVAARAHSSDIPDEHRQELEEIIAAGTKRGGETGRIDATLHRMRVKTAQALTARIQDLDERIRDV